MNQTKNEKEICMEGFLNEGLFSYHKISDEEILRIGSIAKDLLHEEATNRYLEAKQVLENALKKATKIDEETRNQIKQTYQLELYKSLKLKNEKVLNKRIIDSFKEQEISFKKIKNLPVGDVKTLQECCHCQLEINELEKTLNCGLQGQITEKKKRIEVLRQYSQANAYKNACAILGAIIKSEITVRQSLISLKSSYSLSVAELTPYLHSHCPTEMPEWFTEIEETLWGPLTLSKELSSLRKGNINILNWKKKIG